MYHLAEGDWCWCTVSKHWYPLSLEEGQQSCSLATYHRHRNTPLGARHWRKKCNAKHMVTFPVTGLQCHRPLPVPNYSAWWYRREGVNNLPRVVTQLCSDRQSCLQSPPDHKYDPQFTVPPCKITATISTCNMHLKQYTKLLYLHCHSTFSIFYRVVTTHCFCSYLTKLYRNNFTLSDCRILLMH